MRNGFRRTRRFAAVVSLLLVALVVTGPGAGAASTLQNYSAQASGTTLSLNVSLPLGTVLEPVLKTIGISGSTISERISFSNATADVSSSRPAAGTALGQVFFGSLDPLLLQVSRLVGYTASKLPEAAARVGGTQSSKSALLALDLPDATTKLIHIGVGEAEASASKVGSLVTSHSRSTLAAIKVDLTAILSNQQIQTLLAPVEELLDGTVIPQINGLLGTIEKTLNDTGLVNVDLQVPKIKDLLNKPLLSIGIIESISDTGFKGAARTAHGITRLANVDILGGFIHLDALTVDTYAQIDGTTAGAKPTFATQRILGLKIGDNIVNLNTGSLQVLGKTIEMPAELTALLKTTVDTLGLKVAVAQPPQITRTATHARAAASTLHLELAPKILGSAPLFSVSLDGPASVADVRGGSVLGSREIRIPTTGFGDNALWLGGFAIMGLALGVRRFALSR